MSGRRGSQSMELRAKRAAIMRALNADPEFTAKRKAGCKSDFNRLRKRQIMRAFNKERASNIVVKGKWLAALMPAVKSASRNEKISRTVKSRNRYWKQQQNDPAGKDRDFYAKRARRSSATLRGLDIPDDLLPIYKKILRKVGMKEAVRMIAAQMDRRT